MQEVRWREARPRPSCQTPGLCCRTRVSLGSALRPPRESGSKRGENGLKPPWMGEICAHYEGNARSSGGSYSTRPKTCVGPAAGEGSTSSIRTARNSMFTTTLSSSRSIRRVFQRRCLRRDRPSSLHQLPATIPSNFLPTTLHSPTTQGFRSTRTISRDLPSLKRTRTDEDAVTSVPYAGSALSRSRSALSRGSFALSNSSA